MKRLKTMFIACLLFSVLLPLSLKAQKYTNKKKKIEFSADRTKFDEKIGKGAKRLIGNVVFRHESVIMKCDSAWLFNDETLIAYNNVHIQHGDSIHLHGDLLKYNGNTKKAELQKNIRMTDKDLTLSTELLFYDINERVANYTGGGKIVTSENVLTSQNGYYYAASRELGFKKNVVLTNPEYVMNCDTLRYNTVSGTAYFLGPTTIKSKQNLIYCENGFYDTKTNISRFSKNAWIVSGSQKLAGDSLYYDRNKGYGKAMRNVSILDTAERMSITGQLAEYFEETEVSQVTGKPVLSQFFKEDTLYMGADTLRSEYSMMDSAGLKIPDHSKRLLRGYSHVKIFKSDMQGKCDSAAYSFQDSSLQLYGKPVIWSEKEQLTGTRILIKMMKGQIQYMDIVENAFIISKEDSIHFNQVKGKKMRGHFLNNELSRINVQGNGQTLYFPKEKERIIAANKTECSEMMIYVKEKDIDKIVFITRPNGKLIPLSMFPENDLRMKGFVWREEEKPLSKADVIK